MVILSNITHLGLIPHTRVIPSTSVAPQPLESHKPQATLFGQLNVFVRYWALCSGAGLTFCGVLGGPAHRKLITVYKHVQVRRCRLNRIEAVFKVLGLALETNMR